MERETSQPTAPSHSVARWLPIGWAVALSMLILGPALLPGYVLIRDMVWVPNLNLRADVLGLGTGVPRAVPSDALVAVLDEVLPGMVLQKIMLLGSLVAAGVGFARLVGPRLDARMAATTFAIWNPYVVERLASGHWPMIVCVGVLPWLVAGARQMALHGRFVGWLPILVVLGSLNANAGVASSLAVLVFGWRRCRAWWVMALCCLVAQLPWLVAGLVHADQARSAGGYEVFAANSDGLPLPLAALTLGGIWNTDVVPESRSSVLAWIGLGWLVLVAAAGIRRLLAEGRRDILLPAGILWVLGWGIAVLGWAAPGVLGAVGEVVPGVAMFRDSARMLVLCLPLTILLVGHGVAALADLLSQPTARFAVLGSLVALPLMVLPDAAGGIGGNLRAVQYPSTWTDLRPVVDPSYGDALYLPLANYRVPEFNGHRPVTDPLPRLLRPSAVVDDNLVVNLGTVAGEDPRATRARAALDLPTPSARSRALAELGIGWVFVQEEAGPAVDLAGERSRSGDITVVKLAEPADPPRTHGVGGGLIRAAWLLHITLILGAIGAVADIFRKKFRQ